MLFRRKKKIELPQHLFIRLEQYAQRKGYSSANECALHLLEKALANDSGESSTRQSSSMEGLGYL